MRTLFTAVLIVSATCVSAQTPQSGFCERLAPKLDMKQKGKVDKAGIATYQVNALGGLKTFLVGGSTSVSFGVEPVAEPATDLTVADYTRLQKTCAQAAGGIVCTIAEPVNFTVQMGEEVVEVESLPGEKATVAMRKTKVSCRNG